jgi:hypothetical protein
VRCVASVLAAGIVAGILVAGLGGRLVMRVLAATSSRAQGLQTDADATVGKITLGGTVSILIFVGVLLPVAASFVYLAGRRILPNRSWIAGLLFGLVLLALFGVGDPLSPDNVDFAILSPLPLAVGLIVLTGLLFGTTFSALAARLDASMAALTDEGRQGKLPYTSLVLLIIPLYLAPALVYIGVRTVARGRIAALLDRPAARLAGRALLVIAVTASAAVVGRTIVEIL